MCDYPNDEYSFNDSFDESSGEYDSDDFMKEDYAQVYHQPDDYVSLDIDSEEEMLGYGIGVILLNLGMYLVGPAFAVVTVRKYFIK